LGTRTLHKRCCSSAMTGLVGSSTSISCKSSPN
jgi:hypothetical protein